MTAASPQPDAILAPSLYWNPLAVTEPALGAWACAWDVWAAYLERLAVASGPADILEAGARLSMESLDVCNRMASARLGGLRTPLLSDA